MTKTIRQETWWSVEDKHGCFIGHIFMYNGQYSATYDDWGMFPVLYKNNEKIREESQEWLGLFKTLEEAADTISLRRKTKKLER